MIPVRVHLSRPPNWILGSAHFSPDQRVQVVAWDGKAITRRFVILSIARFALKNVLHLANAIVHQMVQMLLPRIVVRIEDVNVVGELLGGVDLD